MGAWCEEALLEMSVKIVIELRQYEYAELDWRLNDLIGQRVADDPSNPWFKAYILDEDSEESKRIRSIIQIRRLLDLLEDVLPIPR